MIQSAIIGVFVLLFILTINGDDPNQYGHLEFTGYYILIVLFLDRFVEKSSKKDK